MTISGKVKNGVVVPDGPVELPEGVVVRIQTDAEDPDAPDDSDLQDLRAKLLELAGTCDGLPDYYAYNLDHYLYGAPRK